MNSYQMNDDNVGAFVYSALSWANWGYNTAVDMTGIRNMAAASDSFDQGNYGDAFGNLLVGYAKTDLLIGGPLAQGAEAVVGTASLGWAWELMRLATPSRPGGQLRR